MWAADEAPLLSQLLDFQDTVQRLGKDFEGLSAIVPTSDRNAIEVESRAAISLDRLDAMRGKLHASFWVDSAPGRVRRAIVPDHLWLKGASPGWRPGAAVEQRPLPPNYYDPVVAILRLLVTAAIETGNPIVWEVHDERANRWRTVLV